MKKLLVVACVLGLLAVGVQAQRTRGARKLPHVSMVLHDLTIAGLGTTSIMFEDPAQGISVLITEGEGTFTCCDDQDYCVSRTENGVGIGFDNLERQNTMVRCDFTSAGGKFEVVTVWRY